jgi:hypothetical protein
MTLYEQWIAQGEARGRAEGEATLLTRLLTNKFGPLSDAIRTRLSTATIPELETWADRMLVASSLEQVFAP